MSTTAAGGAPSEHRHRVHAHPWHNRYPGQVLDWSFFALGTIAAIWLAWSLFAASLHTWWGIGLAVVFWLALAYLALPRLNQILSAIYVPDYFIGRTRTSDGLLGDPINLAFIGTGEQVATAFGKAGWTLADPVDLNSSVRIVLDTLGRRSYTAAPVSPLLLFDRPQDAAYQQQVDGDPGQRHHLRLWRTPPGWLLPGGHRVDWLSDAAYDRRVGLSLFTLQVTHEIDGNIDIERDYVVTSLTTAEPAITIDPLLNFTTGYYSRNGGGNRIHTDGTLPIVDVSALTPAPDAPSLKPTTGQKTPAGVFLGCAITTVAGILSIIEGNGLTGSRSFQVTAWASIVVAVLSIALCAWTLRRSDLARRLVLTVCTAEAALRIADYYLANSDHTRLIAIGHAGLAVLALTALSSATARQWATGQRDLPLGPSRPSSVTDAPPS